MMSAGALNRVAHSGLLRRPQYESLNINDKNTRIGAIWLPLLSLVNNRANS